MFDYITCTWKIMTWKENLIDCLKLVEVRDEQEVLIGSMWHWLQLKDWQEKSTGLERELANERDRAAEAKTKVVTITCDILTYVMKTK